MTRENITFVAKIKNYAEHNICIIYDVRNQQ